MPNNETIHRKFLKLTTPRERLPKFRYGLVCAVLTYVGWGLLPIYWKLLSRFSPIEILSHRIVWSWVFITLLIFLQRQWREFVGLVSTPRILAALTITSLMLAANWLIYIWGVNSGHIIECSLGYFILPLMNFAFGIVVLREKVRPIQAIAIGLATIGVCLRAWDIGGLPIISLGLAFTFAIYGIIRKKIGVPSLSGLGVETLVLLVPAIIFLGYHSTSVTSTIITAGSADWALLVGAGIITSLPLLAFVEATKYLPLTVLGVVQ